MIRFAALQIAFLLVAPAGQQNLTVRFQRTGRGRPDGLLAMRLEGARL
jgi:hypothetical protein